MAPITAAGSSALPLDSLPSDVLKHHLLPLLSPEDLQSTSLVNKKMNLLSIEVAKMQIVAFIEDLQKCHESVAAKAIGALKDSEQFKNMQKASSLIELKKRLKPLKESIASILKDLTIDQISELTKQIEIPFFCQITILFAKTLHVVRFYESKNQEQSDSVSESHSHLLDILASEIREAEDISGAIEICQSDLIDFSHRHSAAFKPILLSFVKNLVKRGKIREMMALVISLATKQQKPLSFCYLIELLKAARNEANQISDHKELNRQLCNLLDAMYENKNNLDHLDLLLCSLNKDYKDFFNDQTDDEVFLKICDICCKFSKQLCFENRGDPINLLRFANDTTKRITNNETSAKMWVKIRDGLQYLKAHSNLSMKLISQLESEL